MEKVFGGWGGGKNEGSHGEKITSGADKTSGCLAERWQRTQGEKQGLCERVSLQETCLLSLTCHNGSQHGK